MAGQDLQRREMLRIMATAAAASKFQGFAKWAFICSHDSSAVERIRPESYQPLFFSPSEYAVVERLTEIIIPSDTTPGAKEAGVAEFVDFMVAHDTERSEEHTLNSSHSQISYAVFCLKKKKKNKHHSITNEDTDVNLQ